MNAIVLSRRNFREFDQIISVYTRDEGKKELLARGIKKITSKNAAHLEPFSIIDIDIANGKEMDHLTKVQPVEYFKSIRQDLEKSLSAQYVVLLIDKLTQVGEADRQLFESIRSWLEFIELQITNPSNSSGEVFKFQILLDGYIVTLLHCLGFSILQNPNVEKWKDTLQLMESGEWESVAELEYDEMLHRKLFEYMQYQTERKIPDWKVIMEHEFNKLN